jgi:mRNA-degrading endonuclease toxin of MazEF toxin-antitoxin module
MKTVPQPGEVWFVDLGLVAKPRPALVLAAQIDARLALASVVLITKQKRLVCLLIGCFTPTRK